MKSAPLILEDPTLSTKTVGRIWDAAKVDHEFALDIAVASHEQSRAQWVSAPSPSLVEPEPPPARKTFEGLADLWERETGPYAFLYEKAMHWAYQRIIGLGPQAIPWILRRLAERSGHWFWALESLTGEDPAAGLETMAEAREAWLAWGRRQYYL
jgi:hypothetical protein